MTRKSRSNQAINNMSYTKDISMKYEIKIALSGKVAPKIGLTLSESLLLMLFTI
jgi:hypothetical protein